MTGDVPSALARDVVSAFAWVPVPDGVVSDPAGWWREPGLLARIVDALAAPYRDAGVTVVIGPESRGFLLGGLVARELGAGFVEAYKYGVASPETIASTTPDGLTLAVRRRLLSERDRVLAVDDWVETGAQLRAVEDIVRQAGATWVGGSVIATESDDYHAVIHVRDLG